jgi:general stress protein YciG
MNEPLSRTHLRGFAALTPDRRREIARNGGKRAHELGTAHQWTREEAIVAGRKGGRVRATIEENDAEISE